MGLQTQRSWRKRPCRITRIYWMKAILQWRSLFSYLCKFTNRKWKNPSLRAFVCLIGVIRLFAWRGSFCVTCALFLRALCLWGPLWIRLGAGWSSRFGLRCLLFRHSNNRLDSCPFFLLIFKLGYFLLNKYTFW